MPRLLEADAEFLTLNYDTLAPDKQAEAKDWLQRYKQQQADEGEPLFPSVVTRQVEQENNLRRMFEAPDKIDYDPGYTSADPMHDKMQHANMALLSARYQKEPAEVASRYDFLLNDYARQKLGASEDVDTAKFYALAQKDMQRVKLREDTQREGMSAALRGEDGVKALAAWQAKNADRAKEDAGLFMRGYQQAIEQDGEMLPIADRLLPLLESQSSKNKQLFDQTKAQELGNMIEQLAGMKKAQRKSVYRSISARIEAAGYDQKGFWSQMLGYLDQQLYRAKTTLSETGGIASDVASNFPAMLAEGMTGNRDFGMTPAETAQTDASVARRKSIGNVQEEIMQIVSGELDPVKPTTGWMNETLETGLIKGPGAVAPFMAASALLGPYGAGFVFTADFAAQNRRELVQSGLDDEQAQKIAVMAAPFQAAVESLSNMVSLGKFPAVQAALSRFTRPVGGASLVGRYVQNSLISGATEFTEEQVQDNVVVPAMQELLGALEKDVPGVDWSFYKTRAANATPELAATLLPMALVFGGVMTAADARLSDRMTSNVDALTALNYSQAQATEIVQEKTPEARIAKAASLWRSRAGNKATLEKGAAKLAERLKALSGDAVAYQAELERRGVLPRVMHTAENDWLLTFNDGSTARFATHDEASTARWTWAEDQLGRVHALTREALTSMERNMSTNRELGVEFKPDVRMVEAGQTTPDIQRRVEQGKVLGDIDPNEAFDTASMVDRATAEADGFLSSYQILGSSRNEFKDGVLRTTIKLWEGSNVLTLVEEKLEGDAKAIVASRGGRGWMLAALRNYEQESGDKLFREVPDDQLTDDDLVEAWSHLGQSYLVGRSAFGEPLQQNNMRRFSRLLMRAGLAGALNSESTFWQAVVNRAQKLGELKAAGKLGEDVVAELEKQLGIDSQVKHEQAAMQEVQQVRDEVAQQVDTSGYSEATPGPNGETFSLAKWSKNDNLSNGFLGTTSWQSFRDSIENIDPSAKGGVSSRVTSAGTKDAELTSLWRSGFTAVPNTKEDARGGEHVIEFRNGRAYKQTHPETFGAKFSPETPGSLVWGTPLEYLQRWRLFNEIFDGADVKFEGVVMHPNGALSLKISQPIIEGPHPSIEHIQEALKKAGWKNIALNTWEKTTSRGTLLMTDAKPENFKVSNGTVVPVDVIVSLPTSPRAIPADASKVVQMPDGARLVGPTTFSIRAYHGTPHKVDKFTTAKIGTGEGAQAYGWGLYFAERQDVAEGYQSRIAGAQWVDKTGRSRSALEIGESVYEQARKDGYSVKDADELRSYWSAYAQNGGMQNTQGIESIRAVVDGQGIKLKRSGNLYTVELLPDESEFLDWDKPLSEQSEKVKAVNEAMQRLTGEKEYFQGIPWERPGSWLYHSFAKAAANVSGKIEDFSQTATTNEASFASQVLAQAGIPGIRYLDGGSRGAGDGTRNYVIFDENLVRILEENGKPVAQETFSLARWSKNDNLSNDFLGNSGWKSLRDAIQNIDPAAKDGNSRKRTGDDTKDAELISLFRSGFTALSNSKEDVRGEEHSIEFRGGRAFKQTHPETFGFVFDPQNPETLKPGTPLQYLQRWRLFNELFPGADVRFEGVVMHSNGALSMKISQPELAGPRPTHEQISKTLSGAGWKKIAVNTWVKQTSRGEVMLTDAKPANFILQGDLVVPVDVITAIKQPQNAETFSLRVTPAQDAEYMAAVEAGDMEKAQRMVDEAAKKAFPESLAIEPITSSRDRIENKPLLKLYHGTNADFNIFERGRIGVTNFGWLGVMDTQRHGIFFAENKDFAKTFAKSKNGNRVIEAFLNVRNPFSLQDAQDIVESRNTGDEFSADFNMANWFRKLTDQWEAFDGEQGKAFVSWLESKGYDGAIIQEAGVGLEGEPTQDVWVALSPNQIKSADPVTRDESGNVIPLSQRFNPADDRITYSLRPGDFASRVEAMFSPFQRSPEARLVMARVAKDRALRLGNELIEKANVIRRIADLEREAKTREALKADELVAQGVQEKEARRVAKQQAADWLTAERKKVGSNKAQRDRIKAWLRVLDGILAASPPEVRARVGGFVKMAGIATDEAALRYLEDRVAKLDKELEKWLKKDATGSINRLFKKAAADYTAGKKAKGKLGPDEHYLFQRAEAASEMDAAALRGELAKLDVLADDDSLSDDQRALAVLERGIVELVGDMKNADSGRLFTALDELTRLYSQGVVAWKAKQTARREARQAVRDALKADAGKSGVLKERQAMEKAMTTLFGKAKSAWLSVSSFSEVLRYAFGAKSQQATELIDGEREASNAYEDEQQAIADELEAFFASMAGGKTLDGERLRFDMAQRTIKAGDVELSQFEAITALLMWRQEDGRRHMEGTFDENGQRTSGWSYDQAWIDEVEKQLTPEGRRFMAWLAAKYGSEHGELNALYRERHGVNLPAHDNYAPITVKPMQAKAGEIVDPVSGAAVSGSILTPGSLRTRSRMAIAEPEFRDALQTFVAHKKQMGYWKAYYDLATDVQAVLGNRELMNSVEAAAGKEAVVTLRKWMDVLAQGGVRDAAAGLAMNSMFQRMMSRAATVGLLGRVSTLLVQSTQLAAASVQMPVGAYLRRFGKLLAGQLDWKGALQSDFIQRRIQTAPPIVRQAMENLGTATRPNLITRAVRNLGNLLSGADGLFTGGTYAILLDYHRETGSKLGLTGADLEEHAHREAERATEQVAQPTRTATRSLAELTATNPLAKVSFAYASEARQKIALLGWAAVNFKADPVRFGKAAFLVFGVGGVMSQVLKNIWKEAKGDDDEEKWSPERLIKGSFANALHGIPMMAELMGEPGMFSSVKWADEAASDLLKGEADLRDINTLLGTLGLFNDTAAGIAALSNAGYDVAKIIEAAFAD